VKKIAIVGTALTSSLDAPYDDPSWDIWSIAANYQHKKRFDLWFELHTMDVLKADGAKDDYFQHLKDAGNKLVIGHSCVDYPEAQLYPREKIFETFPDKYFNNQIALMLAYAILQMPERIGIWGVDMTGQDDYQHQRSCVEHYIGIAKGMGIPFTFPPETPLCRGQRVYALEDSKFSREMVQRLKETRDAIASAKISANQLIQLEAQERLLLDLAKRWG
jgi:hypothetical protein